MVNKTHSEERLGDVKRESEPGRLSDREFWDEKWGRRSRNRGLGFDPNDAQFRELHALFKRTLPADEARTFVEVGCFPGNYMWYFNRYFRYKVAGVEYVERCCELAKQYLDEAGIDATVNCADVFEFSVPPDELFDVVASFGFVEHFEDTREVLERHLSLVKDDGYAAIVVPNHQGIYGSILKKMDPEGFATHNRMSLKDFECALSAMDGVSVVEKGYFGRIGFWNCGLYRRASRLPRALYLLIRGPLWILECVGRLLPNSSALSPSIAVVLRKSGQKVACDAGGALR